MKVRQEFSKAARYYDNYNTVQEQAARKLVSWIDYKPQNILDVGCGSGAVYKKIDWMFNRFTGIDFSPLMLKKHPTAGNVTLLCKDFNSNDAFENLLNIDCVTASSSLQWSDNIEDSFSNLLRFNAPAYFAIFTANTFASLNKTANIKSLLPSKEKIMHHAGKYTIVRQEVQRYSLHFNSKREMFGYIKKSGVSGHRNIFTYKQTKELILNYPLLSLEFEVVFLNLVNKYHAN